MPSIWRGGREGERPISIDSPLGPGGGGRKGLTWTGTRDFICDPSESRREGKEVKGREGKKSMPTR